MTLAYLRYGKAVGVPSLITVHNLAFQGQFGAGIFGELGLPAAAMALDGVEYYGGVGFLKAGLQAAWAITTVSPTYAQEIRTPEFGMGLDGLITCAPPTSTASSTASTPTSGTRRPTRIWSPPIRRKTLKARARQQARRRGALQPRPRRQPALLRGQPADLAEGHGHPGGGHRRPRRDRRAAGDARLRRRRRSKARCSPPPPAIAAASASSSAMTRACRTHAGRLRRHRHPVALRACGLTQLYGLRYGCVPVVARTGGLADTVIDANEAASRPGVATGFQFAPDNGGALLHAIRRAGRRACQPGRLGRRCSARA